MYGKSPTESNGSRHEIADPYWLSVHFARSTGPSRLGLFDDEVMTRQVQSGHYSRVLVPAKLGGGARVQRKLARVAVLLWNSRSKSPHARVGDKLK